jgi:hypothetical protein
MGPRPRGGAYTYDWIENLLGLNMHSADRVLPEFQHPQIGDTIGRNRFRLPTAIARIGMLPMEPGSLVMERKMLRGIKERAERLSVEQLSASSR